MFKLHQMSIKQKVVLGVTLAVLASTLIVGVMAQRQAREVLEHRLVDLELPNILKLIKSGNRSVISEAVEQLTRSIPLE